MREQMISLRNMCLIYDEERILVQEKKDDGKQGLVFPGGPVLEGESLTESVKRDIKEETGLNIYNPQPCGYKDWIQEDGTRCIVMLYKTNQFDGYLKSSGEGRVFWLNRKCVDEANWIRNTQELMEVFESEQYSEFFQTYQNGQYSDGVLLG
ncbi:MAG: NUDIX domain-containing protein [Blautia sp.]|nr:NUDIX domain-containing protein [Blautia sp.]